MTGQLIGKRILVVEDEAIIALMIENMITDMGGACFVAATVDLARALMAETFDAAVLDLNLNGETSQPLAHDLRARGLPFAFATGYGEGAEAERADHCKVLH